MITRGEISDILATLPLLSRQALISTMIKTEELKLEFGNVLVSKLLGDCESQKNRKRVK